MKLRIPEPLFQTSLEPLCTCLLTSIVKQRVVRGSLDLCPQHRYNDGFSQESRGFFIRSDKCAPRRK